MADKLAMCERIKSASCGQFSEEAHSIRSMSAYSDRSARASTPGRVIISKSIVNNTQGGSSRRRAPSIRLSSKSRTPRSQPTHSNRPPDVIVLKKNTFGISRRTIK